MSIIPEKYTSLSPLQEQYRKFWLSFNAQSLSHSAFSSTFKIHPIPSIRGYQDYSIGKPYHLTLKIDFQHNVFDISIRFYKMPKYVEFYENYRNRIENELGYKLNWNQHSTAGYAIKNFAADLYDTSKYKNIADQMMNEGLRMVRIFNKFSE